MVAHDEVDAGALHASLNTGQVEEAFVALGGFRGLVGRQRGDQFGGYAGGVDHLVLGIAGMDADAGDVETGRGGIEVLEFEFANLAAVHGVGPFAAEALDVELVGAEADLFVGIEAYADGAVLDFGVLDEVDHGLHDLGDAGLVVGTEQGVSVGDDEVFALVCPELGELCGRECDALGSVEGDVPAVIGTDDARSHVGTRAVGACVHVGDEADGGDAFVCVGRQGGVEITLVREFDVIEADFFKLAFEEAGKDHLTRRARCHAALLVALRVIRGVLQKSFNDIHIVLMCFFAVFFFE